MMSVFASGCSMTKQDIRPNDNKNELKVIMDRNVMIEVKIQSIVDNVVSARILRNMGLKGHCSVVDINDRHDHKGMNAINNQSSFNDILVKNCPLNIKMTNKNDRFYSDKLSFDCVDNKYIVDGYILDENITNGLPLSIKDGYSFYVKLLAN